MDSLLHRNVLESMGEGVLTVTADGRIGTMNPSASRFLGLDDAEVRGRTITEDLTHREDLEAFNDIVLAAVCDQAVGTRSMIGLRLGDGTERSVAVPDEGTEVEAWREADGSRRKPRVGRLPAPRRVPALHPSLMPWSRTPAPLAADDQTRLLHRRCPSARSAGDGTRPRPDAAGAGCGICPGIDNPSRTACVGGFSSRDAWHDTACQAIPGPVGLRRHFPSAHSSSPDSARTPK